MDPKNLIDLPYDLVRVLCTLLSGSDISALFRTCHNLHALYKDEAFWRELCGRYGVKDPRILGDRSYRAVYTGILHTYGDLLGLWASDHPYKGSVIEFRIDADLKSITGEVWRFWPRRFANIQNFDSTEHPNLPEYFRFMHVALARSEEGDIHAELNWYVHDAYGDWYYGPATASIRVPTLHVVPPSNLGIIARLPMLGRPYETVRLPDFALSNAVWFDGARGLPRLRMEAPVSEPVAGPLTPRLGSHYIAAASDTVYPAAIMVRPPFRYQRPFPSDLFLQHESQLPLEDMRNSAYTDGEVGWFYRRFYPLRSLVKEGQEPLADDWDPASLEGLWLGSYGPHGTEVLFLEYKRHENRVVGWKITGDLNVPRGACSWSINLGLPLQSSELPPLHKLGEHSRFYRGTGTISSTGFLDSARSTTDTTVGIAGKDEIRINWNDIDIDYTPHYIRYKGRNVATETKEHLLRRPVGWVP